jgi:hypothetical protein
MTHPYLAVFSGISSSLGTFALVLAMAGLAGLLSHLVAGRRRELVVRLARGATVIASYLPARQAAVTHPSAALREG